MTGEIGVEGGSEGGIKGGSELFLKWAEQISGPVLYCIGYNLSPLLLLRGYEVGREEEGRHRQT